MTANLNTPSIIAGPLTAADLDRKTNTGRIYHLHRATLAPAGCDNQGRMETRRWHDSGLDSAYGRDDFKPMPKVIPLSMFGRWALAWRRFWLY